MVDSSKLPPANAPKPAQNPAIPGEQSGKVVNLPDSLEVVARARRLEGEVLKQNADGSTRIKTPEGNIDVQVRGKQPQPGTQVQVDIPAGRPPRQVTIRPAPEVPQSQPAQQQPPVTTPTPRPVPIPTVPVNTPPPANQTPAPTTPLPTQPAPTSSQPVPVTPQPTATPPPVLNQPLPGQPVNMPPPVQSTVPLPPLSPLPENTLVRLIPAPTLPATAPQLPVPASVTPAVYTANLIAQDVVADLPAELLNTVKPAITPTAAAPSPLNIPAASAATPAPIPAITFINQAPVTPLPLLANTPPTTTVITAPTYPVPAAAPMPAPGASIPFQPTQAFLLPALDTGDAMIAPKTIAALDVLVTKITLPAPQITQPGATSPTTPAIIQTPQAPAQTAQTITATVTATTPQGQPVVSLTLPGMTQPQSFVLQFPASNLPIGAQIQIIPQPGQVPVNAPAAPPLTPIMPQPLALMMGSRWPVLDEILQTIQQDAPDLAQAIARALPSPANPRALPAAALLFIAAAKAGDLSAWLGDKKIETLQRLGKSSLLGRLSGDGQQVNRLSSEPVSGTDWRAVPLPMFWDNEIHKVALYFKRDSDAQREQNDGEQTRFIFDLSLTRMGEVQIDGLMRGQRLDLIVRTQSPFSGPMMAHMKQLYSSAIEEVNLSGELAFQGDPRAWVNVIPGEKTYLANI